MYFRLQDCWLLYQGTPLLCRPSIGSEMHTLVSGLFRLNNRDIFKHGMYLRHRWAVWGPGTVGVLVSGDTEGNLVVWRIEIVNEALKWEQLLMIKVWKAK
jgi:hypothetical protein